jgi:hypothetical protein
MSFEFFRQFFEKYSNVTFHEKESKKADLEINSSKTEEICVDTIVNQGLRLKGEDIKDHQIFVIWVVLQLKMEVPVGKSMRDCRRLGDHSPN